MNQVSLTGRITHTPEVKVTQSGKHVLDFTIAVRETAEITNFVKCRAWEKTADIINDYATKGSNLAITGSLKVDKYTDKEGRNVEKMYVKAGSVEVLDKRKNDLEKKESSFGFEAKPENFGGVQEGVDPDDLPFY